MLAASTGPERGQHDKYKQTNCNPNSGQVQPAVAQPTKVDKQFPHSEKLYENAFSDKTM